MYLATVGISGVENATSLRILMMARLLVKFDQDQELCELKHSQSSCCCTNDVLLLLLNEIQYTVLWIANTTQKQGIAR